MSLPAFQYLYISRFIQDCRARNLGWVKFNTVNNLQRLESKDVGFKCLDLSEEVSRVLQKLFEQPSIFDRRISKFRQRLSGGRVTRIRCIDVFSKRSKEILKKMHILFQNCQNFIVHRSQKGVFHTQLTAISNKNRAR